MSSSAASRGWGPGWPANRSRDMTWVTAPRSGARFQVHRGIAAILGHALAELENRGFLLDHGGRDVNDDWGYVNRPIRGTRTPSNHSWGLAIDFNAQDYPQGQRSKRPPQWVVDVMRNHGFAWGGTWSHADPMHFEFDGTPGDAMRITRNLGAIPSGPAPAPAPPATPPPVDWAAVRRMSAGVLKDKMAAQPNMGGTDKGLHVVVLQQALNLASGAKLKEDGHYGPATIQAVLNFQKFMNTMGAGITDFPGAAHEGTRWWLVTALENIRAGRA